MTSGPVMYMWLVLSTMIVTSVSAGEYTAPPAEGPMMSEIWGMTPEEATLRRKISAKSAIERRLLDAGAAGVVDADDRAAELERELLDLDDLPAVRLGERAAEDGEVVGEDGHGLAVDRAQAADHAVTVGTVRGHPELGVVVARELVDLLERSVVEELVDAFAGGLLAALVLVLHRLLVAGVGRVAAGFEGVDALGGGAWSFRHAPTLSRAHEFIVHSHQKNLEWTGDQPTRALPRRCPLAARPRRAAGIDLPLIIWDETSPSTNDELAALVRSPQTLSAEAGGRPADEVNGSSAERSSARSPGTSTSPTACPS